jgi:hypothetical protein
MIFEYLLVLQPHDSIVPRITRNREAYYSTPTYDTQFHNQIGETYKTDPYYKPRVLFINCKDKHGPYKLMRRLDEPEIGASFLRTCKKFYTIGLPLLYGKNIFTFEISTSRRDVEFVDRYSKAMEKGPLYKALLWERNKAIAIGIKQIVQQTHMYKLQDRICHDAFLRFIYTIRPRNAALMKSIVFSGEVKPHPYGKRCRQRSGKPCTDDITKNMRLYTPFISEFYTNLRTLMIFAAPDDFPYNFGTAPDEPYQTMKEAMLELLKSTISKIRTLTELRVMKLFEERY